MRARHLFLAAALLLSLPFASQAQILYGATGGAAPSDLYRIDPATGNSTVIGPIGNGVTGMAASPITGIMYGVTTNTACARCLITINLATGAGTVVGPLGLTIAEIDFAPNGALYGWSESGDDLAVINTQTGAATIVADSGLGTFGDGMIFNGRDLYVMPDGDDGDIFIVDTTTGLPTLVGTLTNTPSGGGLAVSAATRHPVTGQTFATVQNFGGPPAFLVRVNLASGVITSVGPTVIGIDAIAFAAAPGGLAATKVPTLSEWMLILLALAMATIGGWSLRRTSR